MKYLFTLLLLTLFILPQMNAQDTGDRSEEQVFKTVEQMPLFPGAEVKAEADKKMLEFIYSNVRYPKQAKDAEREGMAVVSFVVEKDGSLSNVAIERDPGELLGAEAYYVVRKMQETAGNWTPGMQNGEPVRVQFMLPIKFALSK